MEANNTVFLAIIAVASPVIMALVTAWLRRGDKRQDWARQDAVASAVAKVASDVTISNAERTEQLARIKSTGDATHKLVNNLHTEQLRSFVVTLKALSELSPDNTELATAARAAEKALEENELANADPATKAEGSVGGPGTEAIRVEVVNKKPVSVDQVKVK